MSILSSTHSSAKPIIPSFSTPLLSKREENAEKTNYGFSSTQPFPEPSASPAGLTSSPSSTDTSPAIVVEFPQRIDKRWIPKPLNPRVISAEISRQNLVSGQAVVHRATESRTQRSQPSGSIPQELTIIPPADPSAQALNLRFQTALKNSAQFCPLPTGKNGAFVLNDQNELPVLIFKDAQKELGTEESQVLNPDAIAVNQGITPGEGAFSNFFGAVVARAWINLSKVSTDTIYVPSALYVTAIQHANLGNTIPTHQNCASTREGAVIEFIPDCRTLSEITQKEQAALDVESVQFMALIFSLLLHIDGNSGNILIQKTAKGHRIIPIDFTILPKPVGEEGANLGLRGLWVNLPQLNMPTTKKIRSFINNRNAGQTLDTILSGILKNTATNPSGYQHARDLNSTRYRMHQIAFQLCKTGINQNLSLRDIAQCLLYRGEFVTHPIAWMQSRFFYTQRSVDPKELSLLCNAFIKKYKESLKDCRAREPSLDSSSPDKIKDYYGQALKLAQNAVEKQDSAEVANSAPKCCACFWQLFGFK